MSNTKPLPEYRCHKTVWALKIKSVTLTEDGGAVITPHEGFAPKRMSAEYVSRHNPKAGGYYVRYKDGYESFSPAEVFESGYSPAE